MNPTFRLLTALGAGTFVFCPMMKPHTARAGLLPPQTFRWEVTRQGQLNYLLYLPKEYEAQSGRRWPLLLFLHGAGERGTNLQRVTIHGPLREVKQGKDFPFLILAPQCPAHEWWATEPLLQLVAHVTARHAVDTNRWYVSGLSMGGYGTWDLGITHPEKFAAIAPICGGGSVIGILLARHADARRFTALKTLGVWAFHGAKDPVVPATESERMITALRQIGCENVKLTVYPEAGHDAWTETYTNPALYEWLLQHQRRPMANQP